MSELAKAGVRGAKWSALTTVARFGMQLVAQIILARIIGPDAYGVFGMGLVFFAFSNFLATFGFGWSLGQLKNLSDDDIRFAFTWQMVMGCGAALLLFFLAPLIADYFRDSRVDTIVRWMALNCIINAAASVPANLMRRDLNFRATGLIQLASYFVGYIVVGIPIAMLGGGINALIAAWLIQSLLVLLLGWKVHPHPVLPLFKASRGSEIMQMGSTVFLTNLVNWLINNLDRIILGRLFSAHALGLYSAGYNLANTPNILLVGTLQTVFLSAGVHIQGDLTRLRRAYMQVCATIWVVLLPAFVLAACMSKDLILLMYGPAWSESAGVLAILLLGMPALVTWGVSTPILWNTHRPRYEMLLQLPLIPLAGLGFYWLGSISIVHTAAIASLLLVMRGAVLAAAASRVLSIGLWDWGRCILRGAAVGALIAAAATLCSAAMQGSSPLLRIVVLGASGLVVGLLAAGLLPGLLVGRDAASMLVRFFPRLRVVFAKQVA